MCISNNRVSFAWLMLILATQNFKKQVEKSHRSRKKLSHPLLLITYVIYNFRAIREFRGYCNLTRAVSMYIDIFDIIKVYCMVLNSITSYCEINSREPQASKQANKNSKIVCTYNMRGSYAKLLPFICKQSILKPKVQK